MCEKSSLAATLLSLPLPFPSFSIFHLSFVRESINRWAVHVWIFPFFVTIWDSIFGMVDHSAKICNTVEYVLSWLLVWFLFTAKKDWKQQKSKRFCKSSQSQFWRLSNAFIQHNRTTNYSSTSRLLTSFFFNQHHHDIHRSDYWRPSKEDQKGFFW